MFETLLFDIEPNGTITIYIDEVNMHHKVRLREDARIDSVIFFEEQLALVAHVKQLRDPKKKVEEPRGDRLEAFKQAKSLEELTTKFAQDEVLVFRIFDKIKVRVDTTKEFPLDINCTLIFGPEDLEEYQRLVAVQEAEKLTAAGSGKEGGKILPGVVEAENLDADV